MIENNQSFSEAQAIRASDICDWTLHIDVRSATNLVSKQADLGLPSPFVEVSWSHDLLYERNGDVRQFSDSCQLTNSPSWSQRLVLENDF